MAEKWRVLFNVDNELDAIFGQHGNAASFVVDYMDEIALEIYFGRFHARLEYYPEGVSFYMPERDSILVTDTTPCNGGGWHDAEEAMTILFDVSDKLDIPLRGWPTDIVAWLYRFPFLTSKQWGEYEHLVYVPGCRYAEKDE